MRLNILPASILGILFFVYTLTLTQNIPFFWEDTLFLQGVSEASYTTSLRETVRFGTNNFSHPGIPLTIILLKIITFVSNIDPFAFRIFRAFMHSTIVVASFFFLSLFNLSLRRTIFISLLLGFSYPLFLTTFFIPRPETTGIAFKIIGLIFFFIAFLNEKTLSTQKFRALLTAAFIFLFIAMKFASPLYFLAPTLFFFVALFDYKRFLTYGVFILLLFAVYFPLNIQELIHGKVGTYSVAVTNPLTILGLDNPLAQAKFTNLYYLTLPQVITPFGIASILFILGGAVHQAIRHKRQAPAENKLRFNQNDTTLLLFIFLDCLFNFLIMFATPDPATRYFVFFIIPLLTGITFIVFKMSDLNILPRPIITLSITCLIIMAISNIGLSFAYRFTWGSSFIGMDNVNTYLQELSGKKNITLFYYSNSVADEYAPVRIKCGKFTPQKITFIKKHAHLPLDINEIQQEKQRGNEVYVLKRTTSFTRTAYPPIDFSSIPAFKEVKIIEGQNSIIDTLFLTGTRALPIKREYQYNRFYIYKYQA